MEDANRVDFVAEILEGFEGVADTLGEFEVSAVDGPEHFLGKIGTDADTTGGEAVDLKFGEVGDGGLLANAADDEPGIDDFNEAGEVVVLGRFFANDGVFDPRNESVVDK